MRDKHQATSKKNETVVNFMKIISGLSWNKNFPIIYCISFECWRPSIIYKMQNAEYSLGHQIFLCSCVLDDRVFIISRRLQVTSEQTGPPGAGHWSLAIIHHDGHGALRSLHSPDMGRGPGHSTSGVGTSTSGLTFIHWMGQKFVLRNFQNLLVHITDFRGAPIFIECLSILCVWCFT